MGLKIPRSTTLAPPSPRLAVGTAQHRSFPRSLVHPPTSTPKPRAEGRVRAGGTQATSRPERERRSSPSAPAKKPAKTLGFCRFSFCTCCMVIVFTLVRTPGFLTRLHPPPTAATLSSTQNAPGFAFFWLNRVRFLFLAVFRAQNFWTGFCASCRTAITG